MVAHSPALALAFPKTREAIRPAEAPRPQAWLFGKLRYPSKQTRPTPRERFMRFFYGKLHKERYSPEEKPVLPDFRTTYGSRAEARSYCKTPDDFIVSLPFGGEPLGDDIIKSPTFCRPKHPKFFRQDAEDAKVYTSDLEERICVERINLFQRIGEVAHRTVESARSVRDEL